MYDKAIELYEKAIFYFPYNERSRVNMAIAYYSNGNKDKSIYVLSQAQENNPYAFESFLLLGTIYNEQKLYDQAIDNFLKAIKIKLDSTEAYNGLGIAYQNKGNISNAKESFEKNNFFRFAF